MFTTIKAGQTKGTELIVLSSFPIQARSARECIGRLRVNVFRFTRWRVGLVFYPLVESNVFETQRHRVNREDWRYKISVFSVPLCFYLFARKVACSLFLPPMFVTGLKRGGAESAEEMFVLELCVLCASAFLSH